MSNGQGSHESESAGRRFSVRWWNGRRRELPAEAGADAAGRRATADFFWIRADARWWATDAGDAGIGTGSGITARNAGWWTVATGTGQVGAIERTSINGDSRWD